MLLAMRLVHIVLGAFWVGTLIFTAFFLGPAVRDAGPEGGKVMEALMRRRFMNIMPVVAILTLASGVWLYWFASAGFQPAYMRSPAGMTIGIGALAAVAAFVLGVGILRPAMLKAARLSQDPAQLAAAQALRMRAAVMGQVIAALLAAAAAAMAIARYV